MNEYGYEQGSVWSATGNPPRPYGPPALWYRITPWDAVPPFTWIKLQPLCPMIQKLSDQPIEMITDRGHPWANGLKITLVDTEDGRTVGVETPKTALVPVHPEQVPEEFR